MWLKQARALATPDKQKEIDIQMREVQKKANEGSLFADPAPQARPATQQQPSVPQQPPVNGTANRQQADGQMQMFAPQPERQPMQQPAYHPAPQPMPQPQMIQPQPVQQAYQPEMQQPQPMYGQYYQQPMNGFPGQPTGQQPAGQPQIYIQQPGGQPQQPQQWQQPQPMPQQPQMPTVQTARGGAEGEYRSQPQSAEALCFDKDDESDMGTPGKKTPMPEYLDFPEELTA